MIDLPRLRPRRRTLLMWLLACSPSKFFQDRFTIGVAFAF